MLHDLFECMDLIEGETSCRLRRQGEEEGIPPALRRPDRDLLVALDRITLRALAKDPRDRFASANARGEFVVVVKGIGRQRRADEQS